MQKGYFITGTDTNVGKTWATIALMHYFRSRGKSVVGMKPVASGCFMANGRLVNEDALQLQQHASAVADYELINPYAYAVPVSPHIAGKHDPVSMNKVLSCFDELKQLADIVFVEGAGGWYSPINDQQAMADLAKALALPVIVVVAIKLGCINHAKLTCEAIQQAGVNCAGWIAMYSDPDMLCREATINTLKSDLALPLLGILPYAQTADFDLFAQHISL